MDKVQIKRFLFLFAALCAILLQQGCCYHVGSIMHPQIKSIAIAPVTNDTLEPYGAGEMRSALCEAFMVDNSLSVKSMSEADCILYCRIKEIKTTATQEDSGSGEYYYKPAEWQVQVTADFTVIIPGRSTPLLGSRTASGSAYYQVFGDQSITRANGVRMACFYAAEQIVEYTTEAW